MIVWYVFIIIITFIRWHVFRGGTKALTAFLSSKADQDVNILFEFYFKRKEKTKTKHRKLNAESKQDESSRCSFKNIF